MPLGAAEISKEEALDVIYENVSKEALEINPIVKDIAASWDNERPQLENFFDISEAYAKEKVLKDINDVRWKESKLFDKPETKIGLIGEVVILEGLETEKWLSNVQEVFPASKFDDFNRGIDLVLRFKTESPRPVYLGIDLKTTRDKGKIRDRIRLIEEKLDKGELYQLKYFEDNNFPNKKDRILGKLDLPAIVLALDPRFALIMQQVIAKNVKKEKINDAEDKKVELIKNMLIIQLLVQLMELEMYFDKKQLSNPRQKAIQDAYLKIIKEISANVNVKALVEYLNKIIKIIASLKTDSPDLFKNLREYGETLQEYKMYNPEVAY